MSARIEEWLPDSPESDLEMLAEVLHAVVHTGAGVGYIAPFSMEESREFWVKRVLPGVQDLTRRVLIARVDGRIVGTVQLNLSTPPNQLHRGDIAKLLVHPDARRQGIARALMEEIEKVAFEAGKTMLTLDTWTDSPAEALYRSMGYVVAGIIPRFARSSLSDRLEPTTIMYKELFPESSPC